MIRALEAADAVRVAALEASCAQDPWSVSSARDSLASAHVRGWGLGEPFHAYLLVSEVADEAEVLIVGTHPEHQRKGAARRLLGEALSSWRERGIQKAFLEVRESNLAARRCYEALGWAVIADRPGYYRDGEDAVVYQWRPSC